MKTILIIFILLTSLPLFAQKDVVKLKNGSEIRGTIISQSDSLVKLKTNDGSLWVFNQNEVLSLDVFVKKANGKGFYNTTSIGMMTGSQISASFQIVNGYALNKKWHFGIGIGLEGFYNQTYVPLFIESRYDILKKASTPFISLGLGYTAPTHNFDRHYGGFLGQAQMGYKQYLNDHIGLLTSVGYRYSHLKSEANNWWTNFPITEITEINRIEFRFGLIFR